jgi:SatD family (SatD)
MAGQLCAVLIADVMESSSRKSIRSLLGKRLAFASRRHLRRKLIQLPYAVTAGDEFQTITRNLQGIPALILDLRAMLRPLSLRVGIGIGEVSDRIQAPVNRLGGAAFQSARRAIESIKLSNRFRFEVLTAFEFPDASLNTTMNLLYGLHDTLVLKIRTKQWATICEFLDQRTLEQTARRLHLDVSTVSRNLKRGYYWQLVETAKVAGELIERAFH